MAVVLDLDGVVLDSEQVWDEVRRGLVEERGARWAADSQRVMMGMSTAEWSTYLTGELGLPMPAEEAAAEVTRRVAARYGEAPPFLPGAVDAVRRLSARHRLGLASSSGRALIDLVLDRGGLRERFEVTVSTEEVARGKPAPDVYVEACRRLDVPTGAAAAVEDSTNGLRAAAAAGCRVVAVPNTHYPPDRDALALAAAVVPSLAHVTSELLARLGGDPGGELGDRAGDDTPEGDGAG